MWLIFCFSYVTFNIIQSTYVRWLKVWLYLNGGRKRESSTPTTKSDANCRPVTTPKWSKRTWSKQIEVLLFSRRKNLINWLLVCINYYLELKYMLFHFINLILMLCGLPKKFKSPIRTVPLHWIMLPFVFDINLCTLINTDVIVESYQSK